MIENVIGKMSLPLGVAPMLSINHKNFTIPMCIEEPSVVAATSSIGKFIAPYTFTTNSTPSIMVGQVHLPEIPLKQVYTIESMKDQLIDQLN
jgi:hydroxymethylglutaryl-CoA reductase